MKEYKLRDPKDLSKEQLARILSDIQDFMYWEEDSGQMFVNKGKDVNGGDLVQFIDELMQMYELYPTVRGPKDWSPKKRYR